MEYPQQDLHLSYTGSGRTWITGASYDHSGTPLDFNISAGYEGFSDAGPAYTDDVTINGLTAKNFQFFVSEDHKGSDTDALMGMEYKTSKASDGNWTGFFETLVKQKSVDDNEFSFFHGRDQGGKYVEMTLGGRDGTRFTGLPTIAPVVKMGKGWRVNIDGVSVKGQQVKDVAPAIGMYTLSRNCRCFTDSLRAMIDTGTGWIAAGSNAVAIHGAIPGATAVPGSQETHFIYPCNTTAEYMPALIFAGKALAIDPLDFNGGPVMPTTDGYMCRSVIHGGTGTGWVVGTPFLRSWYSVFQWGQEPVGHEIGAGAGVNFLKAVHPIWRFDLTSLTLLIDFLSQNRFCE